MTGTPKGKKVVREPHTQSFKGVLARISTFSICGGVANNSLPCAPNAFAISPVKWALRPASFAKVSKMPNFPGPSLIAYHFKVSFHTLRKWLGRFQKCFCIGLLA